MKKQEYKKLTRIECPHRRLHDSYSLVLNLYTGTRIQERAAKFTDKVATRGGGEILSEVRPDVFRKLWARYFHPPVTAKKLLFVRGVYISVVNNRAYPASPQAGARDT